MKHALIPLPETTNPALNSPPGHFSGRDKAGPWHQDNLASEALTDSAP